VDLAHFHPRRDRAATPTVLFASANDEPRKNLPLLLAAFARVLASTPARLVLAGPGDPADALRSASQAVRAAVEVLDPSTDLVDAYSSAWVTVLPSMREAFGLVLVESLACGTPVVAIAGSGGPEEIVRDGIGALARAETPADLAEAIVRGLAIEDRDACRREATQHYGWDEAIVPQLLRVYAG
jgi:phosphatidylinositol alpha-mannosyltransferase